MADPSDLDFGATVRSLAPRQRFFGRFALVRALGRGGMGVVWLARDEKLELEVALKFLPEAVGGDESAVADLARETRRARELAHPHIVRVYDFHQDERLAGISMEWIDGGTLSSLRLQQTQHVFAPARLHPWLTQLAEALDYAHRRARVIHRDLKPANLMVDANCEIKITDFGISASVSDSVTRVSRLSNSSGSPPYMSPQQMSGGRPAASDDIYAVGATIYELLTGRPPFYSGNIPYQVMEVVPPTMAQRREELGVDGDPIPPDWEACIAACLAKQPEARPHSAGEILQRLSLPAGAGFPRDFSAPSHGKPASAPHPAKPGPENEPNGEPGVDTSAVTIVQPRPLASPTVQPRAADATADAGPTRSLTAPEITGVAKPASEPAPPTTMTTTPAARRRRRGRWIVAMTSVVGMAGIAAWLLVPPSPAPMPEPLPTPPFEDKQVIPADEEKTVVSPTVSPGRMRVRTVPTGARLTIPGTADGPGPWLDREVPAGPRLLRVSAPGYHEQELSLDVSAGELTDVGLITLELAKAGLSITARAADVTGRVESIALDAPVVSPIVREGALPLDFDDLPTGAYRVTMRRDGWPDEVRQVMLEADDEKLGVTGGFPEALLLVTSYPEGATILLGERERGVTPLELVVAPGEYAMRARFRDWPELSHSVVATEGGRQEVALAFPVGGLEIRSAVSSGSFEVLRDDAVLNRGSLPTAKVYVPAGAYAVVAKSGVRSAPKQSVVVEDGRDSVVTLDFGIDRKSILERAEAALNDATTSISEEDRVSVETMLAHAWARHGDGKKGEQWLRSASAHAASESVSERAVTELLIVASAMEVRDVEKATLGRLKLTSIEGLEEWRRDQVDRNRRMFDPTPIGPGDAKQNQYILIKDLVQEGALRDAQACLKLSSSWSGQEGSLARLAWALTAAGRASEAETIVGMISAAPELGAYKEQKLKRGVEDRLWVLQDILDEVVPVVGYLRKGGWNGKAEQWAGWVADLLKQRSLLPVGAPKGQAGYYHYLATLHLAVIRATVHDPAEAEATMREYRTRSPGADWSSANSLKSPANRCVIDALTAWRRYVDASDPAPLATRDPSCDSVSERMGAADEPRNAAYLELCFSGRIDEAVAIAEQDTNIERRVARLIQLSLFGLREEQGLNATRL